MVVGPQSKEFKDCSGAGSMLTGLIKGLAAVASRTYIYASRSHKLNVLPNTLAAIIRNLVPNKQA